MTTERVEYKQVIRRNLNGAIPKLHGATAMMTCGGRSILKLYSPKNLVFKNMAQFLLSVARCALRAQIKPSSLTGPLLLVTFCAGVLDTTTYFTFGTFASNQTG
jgi:hypothetical protein